jgi:ribosomal protein L11 methyltransferase
MDYMKLHFKFLNRRIEPDILIAQLSQLDYEGFEEIENELLAYIPAQEYSAQVIDQLNLVKDHPLDISYENKLIKDKNWNALWESNYPPVIFPGKCIVRAPFHPQVEGIALDIVIEPKMAFGTAHHDTTWMMVDWLLSYPPHGLSVLDMGCGTGILAILASKLGAHHVTAIDDDKLAYENTLSNMAKNNVTGTNVYFGDATLIAAQHYDLILANINRNILIKDIPLYSKSLVYNGTLVISGFYPDDLPIIKDSARQEGMTFRNHVLRNEWVAAIFEKNQQADNSNRHD